MEHRYTERYERALPIMVSCPRLGMVRAWTVNISTGGVFIVSDCASFPLNAPVTVAFMPEPEAPQVCIEASGMVVHQSPRGFGVMFDDLDPACHGMLAELIADAVVHVAGGSSGEEAAA